MLKRDREEEVRRSDTLVALAAEFPAVEMALLERALSATSYELASARAVLAVQVEEEPAVLERVPSLTVAQKIIQLDYDAVLFKGLLNADRQLALVSVLTEVAESHRAKSRHSVMQRVAQQPPAKIAYPAPVVMHNWGGRSGNVEQPEELFAFVRQVLSNVEGYSEFNPDSLYAIMYGAGTGLHSHQDGALGEVLNFSFGSDCVFRFGPHQDTTREGVSVMLESGDAILFNGQKYFHEVLPIDVRHVPAWWTQNIIDGLTGQEGLPGRRMSVQFRDPAYIQFAGKKAKKT